MCVNCVAGLTSHLCMGRPQVFLLLGPHFLICYGVHIYMELHLPQAPLLLTWCSLVSFSACNQQESVPEIKNMFLQKAPCTYFNNKNILIWQRGQYIHGLYVHVFLWTLSYRWSDGTIIVFQNIVHMQKLCVCEINH